MFHGLPKLKIWLYKSGVWDSLWIYRIVWESHLSYENCIIINNLIRNKVFLPQMHQMGKVHFKANQVAQRLKRAIFWHLYSSQYLSLQWRVVSSACDLVQMDWSELRMKPDTCPCVAAVDTRSVTSISGKPKGQTLCSIFCSSRVFGLLRHTHVKWNLLGFMKLIVSLLFWTFPFEGKRICGVTSSQQSMKWSAVISNYSTKQYQNGFKISTRDKYSTHLR